MSRVSAKPVSAKGSKGLATLPKPTDAELAILQAIWRNGPITQREICEQVSSTLSPKSVTKYLNIMMKKGLIEPQEHMHAWRYSAIYSQEEAQQQLVSGLVDKAFGGSTLNLIMNLVGANNPSAKEIAAIKSLFERQKKS